jgi:iron-sulfur cluster repair protein YtfE (RIC family)
VVASAAAAEAGSSVDVAQQRLLQRLRESNIELSNKLKALTEGQSRDLERNQQAHLDQQRFERQLEELRQQHAQELSELMAVLVQQVDGIHKEHAAQVRKLETELERLRRGGEASAEPPPPARPAAVPSTRR